MTERFKKFIPVILQHEGGFVNDKDDPGGATNYGISLRFLKGTGELKDFDLDHDGDIDIEDVRILTPDIARMAYYDYFYHPLKVEMIPSEQLALQVFDHAVNAGSRTAVRLLQRILHVDQDGVIGPITLAASMADPSAALHYKQAREDFYHDLTRVKPVFNKYLKGWLRRVQNTYDAL
ncbi:MAG TPA: glycosyl hydrolase 108 family protein [Bacteroidales bacterium]|nr:glycosyl hydrolase 108 family protein [Bacteroidales bacterium]HSA43591.1 glycosyl hydrolase 108 family protein [Bacteroidales bacterium]